MPLIDFESGQLKSETKTKLIRRLTEVSVEVAGISEELFFVSVHELPGTDIVVGGATVTELKAKLAGQQHE